MEPSFVASLDANERYPKKILSAQASRPFVILRFHGADARRDFLTELHQQTVSEIDDFVAYNFCLEHRDFE